MKSILFDLGKGKFSFPKAINCPAKYVRRKKIFKHYRLHYKVPSVAFLC